ncbi:MAG: DNA mismatch repair endonuclease MutL [Mogibacterium sp.]|nr:DNA mismatch repair endonuclease MutL [Mogibacterium sp.]
MIRVLDKFIADKIAAGEVIERPVSAVKELVENSIDAGSHSIIVEIRGGGRSYIRVTDDGSGIPAEEAETAFLRHATSKISGIADLDNITSLGFRGEALASIAAVSKLTMVTRTADRPAGVRLMLHGGRVISNETTGANPGTTIVIEDLFYNTPARRKFMGSEAREGSAIIDLIEQYAVCYADIRFMMIRNGETVFTTAGDGNTLAAIQKIYPDTDHARLIPVNGSRIHGYVSDPGTTRNTRKGQLFFVNGRLVNSPVIEKGLEKGYGGRIFSGFPIAILFIEADPHDIDVNIHPGKKEIRFLHSDEIISIISSAVEEAMRSRDAVPAGLVRDTVSVDQTPDVKREKPVVMPADAEYISERTLYPDRIKDEPLMAGEQSSIRDFLGSIVRETTVPTVPASEQPAVIDDRSAAVSLPEAADRPFSFDDLRFAGYVFDTYIIMESDDSIYMFDQHAAHERIYYEKFTSAYLSSNQLPQPVLTPVTINVSADVYYIGREMLEPLHRMGYDITDFGSGTFLVRGVPPYISLSEAEQWLRAYFESIDNATGRNDTVIDKLIMKSCKSAVKGGEKLSRMEIDDLIKELAACRDPYACPHGRPTFVRFTRYDIERSFRRK